MSFPHSTGTLLSTFGYHPTAQDASQVVRLAQVGRMLVLGSEVPDVVEDVGPAAYLPNPEVSLPRGLYWFAGMAGVDVMLVLDGETPSSSVVMETGSVDDDHPLRAAQGWMSVLWESSSPVPVPAFGVTDEVLISATDEHSAIKSRQFSSGTWLYEVRLEGRLKLVTERQLSIPPLGDDPTEWLRQGPGSVDRFAATLTRAKLEGSLSDTMFSFRATRTMFRAYQFKPVMKMLQTGMSRLLIADEVGLGKTIEAGLIWTELEARKAADRVLIVCPSSLVAKWQREMEERFNFELTELDGVALADFEERASTGRLPKRGFYIGSLERLRRWDGLEKMSRLRVQFDLVIIDEAHSMRNVGTRSNAVGSVLSELAHNLVLLSATPLNLRSTDLYNLIDLLSPGEFGDEWTFDERLAPNAVLHAIGEGLSKPEISGLERLAILEDLNDLTFGAPLLMRPEMELLRKELKSDILEPAAIVRIRRLLADLNAMSATITRTRKVEVEEDKAVRRPKKVEIKWTNAENAFYEQYLAWCQARADASGSPIGFAMQMPLRLASACLPAARDQVIGWNEAASRDEDDRTSPTPASSSVAPHLELLAAATALGDVDTKFDQLLTHVQQLVDEGKRTLLFTFSRPTLDYLRAKLQNHARVAVLHGGVKKEARNRIMADFRAGGYDIVLANRVASEGLDFEFCSVVINYDLPWNPMEIEQRIGRIDRMGQQEATIIVLNFHNPATIDERILMRVLDRIGIFERSIGALEPIVLSNLTQLQTAMFDFALTDEEREYKTNQVLEAMEGQAAGVEELSRASSYLLVSDDVDVRGMESDLLRSGRYVGQAELTRLIGDWCVAAGEGPGLIAPDEKSMTIRGNVKMAQQLQSLVASGRRTTLEVEELITQLGAEMEIHLVLDQELARTTGGVLLTATHPLVLAALAVPGFQQTRFARVRVPAVEDAPAGMYFVQLSIAEWGGLRPGRAIWGSAVDSIGQEAPQSVVERLFSALATGNLEESVLPVDLDGYESVALSSQLLARRQVKEEYERAHETQALLEARRVGLTVQHQRKLDVIKTRMNTARERGKTRVIPLFEAQRTAAERNYETTMADNANKSITSLNVTPLAICQIEVRNE
jgi:superfamily II DNA or RNA helicase